MRGSLRLHRTLREGLWIRGSVLAAGVGLLVVTAIKFEGLQGPMDYLALPGLGLLLTTVGARLLLEALRLRAGVVACAAGADPIALRVITDRTTDSPAPIRQMRLRLDQDGAAPFDYQVAARHGEPQTLGEDRSRIAALRAHSDSEIVVPFLTTAYPFDMPQAMQREIVAEAAGWHREQKQNAKDRATAPEGTWRPDLPARFRASTKFAMGQRASLIICHLLVVVTLTYGVVTSDPHLPAFCFMIGGLAFVLSLPSTLRARSVFGALSVTESGVELSSFAGDRNVRWSAIGCVVIQGVHHGKERTMRMAGSVGGLVGAGVAHLVTGGAESVYAGTGRTGGRSVDIVTRRLREAGLDTAGAEPVIEIIDGAERVRLRLLGTHGWAAARAIVAEAVARDIDVRSG